MRRPKLRDDRSSVERHSKRWESLVAYVRHLNKRFPKQRWTTLCAFFSTEREFSDHIKKIETYLKANG